MMQRGTFALSMSVSMVAASNLRSKQQSNDGRMQPEVVAGTLAKVEDMWFEDAYAFARCDHGCQDISDTFHTSCKSLAETIVTIVQTSPGKAIAEYMSDVCNGHALRDTNRARCETFAQGLTASMNIDAYASHEKVNLDRGCADLWSKLQDEGKARVEAETVEAFERAAAEKRAAEKRAAEKKAAEELAAAKKKAAEEAAAKKKAAEEAAAKRKAAQEAAAKKKAQEEAAAAAKKKAEKEAAEAAKAKEVAQKSSVRMIADETLAQREAAEDAKLEQEAEVEAAAEARKRAEKALVAQRIAARKAAAEKAAAEAAAKRKAAQEAAAKLKAQREAVAEARRKAQQDLASKIAKKYISEKWAARKVAFETPEQRKWMEEEDLEKLAEEEERAAGKTKLHSR